jgi:hypothetical protein
MDMEQITVTLDTARANAKQSVDREWRAQDKAEKTRHLQPGGASYYLPQKSKEEVYQQISNEHDLHTQNVVFDLHERIRDTAWRIQAQQDLERRPHTPDEVCRLVANGTLKTVDSLGRPMYVNSAAELLVEMKRARIDGEMRNATPAEWLATYQSALARYREKPDYDAGLIIFLTETRLSKANEPWIGKPPDKSVPGDPMKLVNLLELIKTTQDGRLSEESRRAERALVNAKTVYSSMTEVHKIRPVKRSAA